MRIVITNFTIIVIIVVTILNIIIIVGWKINYLLPQITLATSSKVVVRLYFNKNQQKCWFKTKERLPTTPFFTQHLSQFSDLSKHTHAIYHLTENLILNHFFYTRKLQIKQHMQLKSSDIFYLFCQK